MNLCFLAILAPDMMDDPFSKIIGIVGIVGVPLAIVTWVVTKFIPSLFAELKVQRDAFLVSTKEQQASFLSAIRDLSSAAAVDRQDFEKQVTERERQREVSVEKRLNEILLCGEKRDERMAEALKSVVNALNQLSELIVVRAAQEERLSGLESTRLGYDSGGKNKERAGARAILGEKHREEPGRQQ